MIECTTCNGTGEVSVIEEVERGNPATLADVGSEVCERCNGTGEVPEDEDEE